MFSELIIAYLFLGGAGAGCCFICSVLGLFAERDKLRSLLSLKMRSKASRPWRRFFGSGTFAALVALCFGAICLIADLGRPEEMMELLLSPAPTYIAFGMWAIVACICSSVVLFAIWMGAIPANTTFLAIVEMFSILSSLAVMAYTGVMLSSIQAVALWSTPWLVVLFILSSLSCGIALLLVSAVVSRSIDVFASTLSRMVKLDAVLIMLEVIAAVAFLSSVWLSVDSPALPSNPTDAAALASLASILSGRFSALFWIGFVGVGMFVPLAQDAIMIRRSDKRYSSLIVRYRTTMVFFSAVCVLCGGIMLRILVVSAAFHPMLG